MRFYFTFGQAHPFRDNYIEIEAPNGQIARDEIVIHFAPRWVGQYDDANWKPEYFPGGRVGRVLKLTKV